MPVPSQDILLSPQPAQCLFQAAGTAHYSHSRENHERTQIPRGGKNGGNSWLQRGSKQARHCDSEYMGSSNWNQVTNRTKWFWPQSRSVWLGARPSG